MQILAKLTLGYKRGVIVVFVKSRKRRSKNPRGLYYTLQHLPCPSAQLPCPDPAGQVAGIDRLLVELPENKTSFESWHHNKKMTFNFSEIILMLTFGLGALGQNRRPTISYITQPEIVTDIGGTVEMKCTVQYGGDFPVVWMKLDPIDRNNDLTITSSK